MTHVREDLRDELLAMLATSRELDREHDAEVAETFLNTLDIRLRREELQFKEEKRPFTGNIRRVQVVSGISSTVVGLTLIAYVCQQFQALASLGTPDVNFGTVSNALSSASPWLVASAICYGGIAVSTCLDALRPSRFSLTLLWAATTFLTGCGMVVLPHAGRYLSTLIFFHYLHDGVVPVFAVVSVALAFIAARSGTVAREHPADHYLSFASRAKHDASITATL